MQCEHLEGDQYLGGANRQWLETFLDLPNGIPSRDRFRRTISRVDPDQFQQAFLDRIRCYLPGWEVPKTRIEYFTEHYGFVVDYLAEALKELRQHNFTEMLDQHFSLGSHLNARDVRAVRKRLSGLVKIVHPTGEFSKEDLGELTETAIEVRRRVKEQLKKMGSFEYHQTSFSYNCSGPLRCFLARVRMKRKRHP